MRRIFFLSSLIGLISCGVKPSAPEAINDEHSSMNSLDWAGVYKGTLPCADCSGIETVIQLNKDGSFIKNTRYTGKSAEIINSTGNFTWNAGGNAVTLDSSTGNTIYKVGENNLLQLDNAGNVISGDMADKYILKKSDELRDKYWKLIELNGQPVVVSQHRKEPHLILKSEGSVLGNGGCNSFSGGYELLTGNLISFSPLAATKMACMEINDEDRFFKIFEIADNYEIRNDTLSLNKARMAPLAKFAAVYLR